MWFRGKSISGCKLTWYWEFALFLQERGVGGDELLCLCIKRLRQYTMILILSPCSFSSSESQSRAAKGSAEGAPFSRSEDRTYVDIADGNARHDCGCIENSDAVVAINMTLFACSEEYSCSMISLWLKSLRETLAVVVVKIVRGCGVCQDFATADW